MVVVVVAVVVLVVTEGLELEIRLLGHLLGKQPPLDLVAAVGMVVVVVLVVPAAAAAAVPVPVPVVVRRLAVAVAGVVVEGAGGVRVAGARGGFCGRERANQNQEAEGRLQTPSMVTTRTSTKRSATMPTTTPNVTASMSIQIYNYTPPLN